MKFGLAPATKVIRMDMMYFKKSAESRRYVSDQL
jgi:hypothetical protein